MSVADLENADDGAIKKLNGHNYSHWKSCIESYLQVKNLWVVTGGSETMSPEDVGEALQKWKIKTGKAMLALKILVEEDLIEYIRDAQTSKAWDAFVALFSRMNDARMQLFQKSVSDDHSRSQYLMEVLPFVGFALAMFVFYSTVPVILKMSGSAMLNLSLLTSDMWAVLIRIFAYHEKVDWMYFISFGAVAIGLLVYSGGDKERDEGTTEVAEASREVDKEMDEEAAGGDSVRECSTIVGGGTSLSNSYRDGENQNLGHAALSK